MNNRVQRRLHSTILLFFFIIFLITIFSCWIYTFRTTTDDSVQTNFVANVLRKPQPSKIKKFQPKCINNDTLTSFPVPKTFVAKELSPASCPEYFRWIHDDLLPWKSSGISKVMIEKAKESADFRLVIVSGKIYVEKFQEAFQTRDMFTIWGFLQLLRLYPNRVPDLELMFSCADRPQIYKNELHQRFNTTSLPVMFQYCGTEDALGVLFPDWTFWGWAETNVKPWTNMLKGILKGNKRIKWENRIPKAYWKGNFNVSYERYNLRKCNVSNTHDWNAILYEQDWKKEIKEGYKNSNLEDQCTHRYKIYIEGYGWSVSEKYIFGCDSMVLYVEPKFYDFFTRSMKPKKHFWPISRQKEKQCMDIKQAVQWGNSHATEAQEIGKSGSKFIQENLKMKFVYDYMFHVLNEYAKLLKFKPQIPKEGIQIYPEKMACSQKGLWKKFMLESMVISPSQTLPCRVQKTGQM